MDARRNNLAVESLIVELQRGGIENDRVLAAIRHVPRELFLPEELQPYAYENRALPIDCEQTISQPFIVALMSQAAMPEDGESHHGPTQDSIVLEIGTGSGYQTAILAMLFNRVITVERHAQLSESAQQTLSTLGLQNITFLIADGTLGVLELAPFDAILVTAAAPNIPEKLVEQLKPNGRLIIPVGGEEMQELITMRNTDTRQKTRSKETRRLCSCRFVKLIGEDGWPTTE